MTHSDDPLTLKTTDDWRRQGKTSNPPTLDIVTQYIFRCCLMEDGVGSIDPRHEETWSTKSIPGRLAIYR